MFKFRHIVAVIPLVLLAECGSGSRGTRTAPPAPGPLVAAVSAETPGFFVLGGECLGYQYELLEAYASGTGRELKLVRGLSMPAIRGKLAAGELDAAAVLSADAGAELISVPLYETGYVLVTNAAGFGLLRERLPDAADATAENFPWGVLDTARIMVSAGFGRTESYDRMLDSLPRARIFLTVRSGLDLVRGLAAGEFDWMICERSEAVPALALTRGAYQACAFPDRVGMSIVFGPRDEGLARGFRIWLDGYRRSGGQAMLQHLYLERGMVGRLASINKPSRVAGGISVWDELLRTVGARESVDWRLLSAIAYHESRFTPDAVSERGAQGLMQVMPVVARQFGADESRVMHPELNVLLAARLLRRIGGILGLPDTLPDRDRLAMLLAAYNAGVGRLAEARRAAADSGADCNDWAALEPFVVPRDAARYADRVLERYDAYCRAVDK